MDDESRLNFSFSFDLSSLIIVSRFLNGGAAGLVGLGVMRNSVPLLIEGGAGIGGGSGG